jgi:hypothetical protein
MSPVTPQSAVAANAVRIGQRSPTPRKFRYKRTIHRACLHTGASAAADSVATMRSAGKPTAWGRPEDSPHVNYKPKESA